MKKLIKTFENNCKTWQNKYKNKKIRFIFNEDLNQLNKEEIKYMLIADNPGQMEAEKKRYLIGPAGISARVFFERTLVSNFKKEVLVLNKTPIYTNTTKELEQYDITTESQEFMVDLIYQLSKILQKPVIIMGYSNGLIKRKDKLVITKNILAPFFHKFAEYVKEKKITDYYIINHFSRNSFYASKYISIEDYENNYANILFIQGQLNKQMFEKHIF